MKWYSSWSTCLEVETAPGLLTNDEIVAIFLNISALGMNVLGFSGKTQTFTNRCLDFNLFDCPDTNAQP